jgi:RNA polymerase sigma-70 factor (ECF subfamily)
MIEDRDFRDLAAKSAAGDLEAVERLIRGFHPHLFSCLHLLGIPSGHIEEVAQDVVLQMYRSLSRYRPEEPFLPWLWSIARHVGANFWRTHRREEERRAGFQRYVEAKAGEPQASLHDVETGRLRECIDRLQDRHREMVRLRYFQGFDSSRIADEMGLSAAAVRQSLSRIRDILRACVGSSVELGAG